MKSGEWRVESGMKGVGNLLPTVNGSVCETASGFIC
jgi:hypothetical protein